MKGSISAERQTSFKKGIEDKTRAREDQQTSIRKQKRNDKLVQRRRHEGTGATGAAARPQCPHNGGPCGCGPVAGLRPATGPPPFEFLLSKFNKEALLLRGDLSQLRNLDALLGVMAPHDLNAFYDAITAPNLIPFLVNLAATERKNDEIVTVALRCMVNLTSTHSTKDLECTNAFMKAHMFDMISQHLVANHAGRHLFMTDYIHAALWELVINVILSCPEGGGLVVRSGLFGFSDMSAGSAGTHVTAAGTPLAAPFNQDLMRIFGMINMTPQHRNVMIPIMMSVIYSIFQALPDSAPPLPWQFIMCCWTYLIQVLKEFQPRQWKESDKNMRYTIKCVIKSILFIVRISHADQQRMVDLFIQNSPLDIMRKLCLLMPMCNDKPQIRVDLVRIMTEIGALPFPIGLYQKCMRECGGIPQLVLATQEVRDSSLRRFAFCWAGNYMADGVEYVSELMTAGLLDSIRASVRQDLSEVSNAAVYALLTMFAACDEDRERNNGFSSKHADGVMGTIVVQYQMFRWVTPFIGVVGREAMTADILSTIYKALRWNRELTLSQLRNNSDATSRLEHLIADLKCNRRGDIYELAHKIENLIDDGEKMEEESAFEGITVPRIGRDGNVVFEPWGGGAPGGGGAAPWAPGDGQARFQF